jgi:AcrR family transcriptional regulator
MYRQGRKAAQSEATRGELISAATRLFAERGYAGVGTEEIVRAAGVTRGALYHHFADKRELFLAVFERVEGDLLAGIAARIAGIDDPWESMLTGMRAFLDACADPTVIRISLVDAPAVLGWREWRELSRGYALGLMSGGLQLAMDAGVLARRPVEPLAHLLLAALTEAGLMVASAADHAAERERVEDPLIAVLAGLRA